MIDYSEYENDEDFQQILEFVRENIIAVEDEVVDGTDLPWATVEKHFRLVQAIVSEEIETGIIYDPDGYEMLGAILGSLR